jgi:hypothetical protein
MDISRENQKNQDRSEKHHKKPKNDFFTQDKGMKVGFFLSY